MIAISDAVELCGRECGEKMMMARITLKMIQIRHIEDGIARSSGHKTTQKGFRIQFLVPSHQSE